MENPQAAATEEQQDRPTGFLEVDAQLVEDMKALLEAGQRGMLLNILADLYPADVARLLTHLPPDEARRIFQWLPVEQAGEVLAESEDASRVALLEETHPAQITEIIDQLETDDAVDVLAGLPDAVARQVLPGLEDVEDLRELLGYAEDTAGGIMGTEYVDVPQDWTVAEATEEVRRNAEAVEEIYGVFVHDAQGRLVGTVSLMRLMLSPASTLVADVMDADLISVTTEVDQEEVARIMQRYDIITLPVVDREGRMVGRITIDDVVDVIREEAEEDIQLMSGVSGTEEHTDSIIRISRGRLPWLLTGLFGAGFSGLVIGTFEEGLAQAVVLAIFIPIVTAMGGNAAVQSAAIAVQGLSSGELWANDVFKRLAKELAVALLNGAVLALLLSTVVLIFGLGDVLRLAATVGLTMFSVIILATTNGALVPFALKRAGVDPASAMGPFVTTLNDIIGLTVYFLIASAIYL